MAMPSASRRIALSGDIPGIVRLPSRSARLGGDGGASRAHDPPQSAEAVDSLPGDIPRCLVLDEVVEGMSGVCDLDLAVCARGRAEKRGVNAGARLGRAVGEQWRPDVGAARVAGGRGAGVGYEEIEGHPLVVDQDLTQLGVVGGRNFRSGCRWARRLRSEERRVGKECRSWGSKARRKKKRRTTLRPVMWPKT